MCLEMPLARMETAVIVNAVLDRLPWIGLHPEADDPHVHGIVFRSPTAVPVVFDPPGR